jgi:hypothetical protein
MNSNAMDKNQMMMSTPSEPMTTTGNMVMPTQQTMQMSFNPVTTKSNTMNNMNNMFSSTNNMMTTEPMTTKSSNVSKFSNITSTRKPLINDKKSKFIDIKNDVEDDNENEENEENEENGENGYQNEFESDEEDIEKYEIEGFQNIEAFRGSEMIQSMQLKNILLALLITFLAYLVAYAAMKNMICKLFPQLTRFKFNNLIYWGLMYLVVYICLEVF